jgi:hypothetical protein
LIRSCRDMFFQLHSVEVPGIEPGSFGAKTGLLRA